jgi:hypothetical protein
VACPLVPTLQRGNEDSRDFAVFMGSSLNVFPVPYYDYVKIHAGINDKEIA